MKIPQLSNTAKAAAVVGTVMLSSFTAGAVIKNSVDNGVQPVSSPTPSAQVTAVPESTPTGQAGVTATVLPAKSDIKFGAATANPKGETGLIEVIGTITNPSPVDVTVDVLATLVDKAGKPVATATGPVKVSAGKTENFQLFTSDFVDEFQSVNVTAETVR